MLLSAHSTVHRLTKQSNDNKKKEDESNIDSDSKVGASSDEGSEEDDDYVPPDYIFLSFMAFVL